MATSIPAPVQVGISRRIKIHPRTVDGRFARWRVRMVWLTQAVFYGLPWLLWNGRQALLFDLDARRFFVFGLVLQPRDLIFLAVMMVIGALALFAVTAVAGRIWCGYACPQTVYTEIFLWIEQRCEGERLARMRLDRAPWSLDKLRRRAGKHAGWIAVSLWTGFTFVGYFTPIRTLVHEVASFEVSGWETFWVLFYAGATYGNAGWMREQVCKFMCPYARFQSALIDKDTIVIAYDAARGDPRGSRSRSAERASHGLGDCVDCTLCVQVCPTGIDIRNGLQNECIGCAACIDACDGVMQKVGYAPGLIRYAPEGADSRTGPRRLLRPRVLVYGGALVALCAAFVGAIVWRQDFNVDVLKDRNTLARTLDDDSVENVYRIQITNDSEQRRHFRVRVLGLPGLVLETAADLIVDSTQIASLPARVALPAQSAEALRGRSNPIEFEIAADGENRTVHERSAFYVPN